MFSVQEDDIIRDWTETGVQTCALPICRKQCLEDVSQPIIIERGPCEARLQQRHHATCFQPFPHLIESMIAIQNREDQSFDPTPTREHMGRMGRDETNGKRGDLPASHYTK